MQLPIISTVQFGIRRDRSGFWPVVLFNGTNANEPKKAAFTSAGAALKAAQKRAASLENMVLHAHLDSVDNAYIETGARGVDWECEVSPLTYSTIPAPAPIGTLIKLGTPEYWEALAKSRAADKPKRARKAAKKATFVCTHCAKKTVNTDAVCYACAVKIEAETAPDMEPLEIPETPDVFADLTPCERVEIETEIEETAMPETTFFEWSPIVAPQFIEDAPESPAAPQETTPEPEPATDSYDFTDAARFMLKQAVENGVVSPAKSAKMLDYYTAIFEGRDPQHLKVSGSVPQCLELMQRSLQAKAARFTN